MKKALRLLLFTAFIVVLFFSCQDETTDPTTLIGTWTCAETNYNPYPVYIDKSAIDSSKYIFSNFANLGVSTIVTAELNGNTLTIQPQSFSDGTSTFSTQGTGTVSNNSRRIDLNYMLDGDEISAVLTKK